MSGGTFTVPRGPERRGLTELPECRVIEREGGCGRHTYFFFLVVSEAASIRVQVRVEYRHKTLPHEGEGRIRVVGRKEVRWEGRKSSAFGRAEESSPAICGKGGVCVNPSKRKVSNDEASESAQIVPCPASSFGSTITVETDSASEGNGPSQAIPKHEKGGDE